MMDETKAVALAQKILEGFNRGEVSSIAGCFHSDVQAEFPYAPPGMSAICSGHSAVVATFTEGRASIDQITITPRKTYWSQADSTLIVEAQGKGRLAKGTEYNNRYVFIIGFQDERVRSEEHTSELQSQM